LSVTENLTEEGLLGLKHALELFNSIVRNNYLSKRYLDAISDAEFIQDTKRCLACLKQYNNEQAVWIENFQDSEKYSQIVDLIVNSFTCSGEELFTINLIIRASNGKFIGYNSFYYGNAFTNYRSPRHLY